MTKTLSVSAIKNGTVIDHIRAGQALRIMKLLRVLNNKKNKFAESIRSSNGKKYIFKLIDEKNQFLESQPNDYKSKVERIDFLLNRRVYLNGDIFLIEENYNKESIEKCIHCLEKITLKFNRIIPADLYIKLKNHFTKIKKRKCY